MPFESSINIVHQMNQMQLDASRVDPDLVEWLRDRDAGVLDDDAGNLVQELCYRRAVAIGRARLFGQDELAGNDGIDLPVAMVEPALRGGFRFCREAILDWDDRDSDDDQDYPFELDDLTADLLNARVDLHAAVLVLAPIIEKLLIDSPEDDLVEVAKAESIILESLADDLDQVINDQSSLVRELAQSGFMQAFQHSIVAEFWESRPWWLTDKLFELDSPEFGAEDPSGRPLSFELELVDLRETDTRNTLSLQTRRDEQNAEIQSGLAAAGEHGYSRLCYEGEKRESDNLGYAGHYYVEILAPKEHIDDPNQIELPVDAEEDCFIQFRFQPNGKDEATEPSMQFRVSLDAYWKDVIAKQQNGEFSCEERLVAQQLGLHLEKQLPTRIHIRRRS